MNILPEDTIAKLVALADVEQRKFDRQRAHIEIHLRVRSVYLAAIAGWNIEEALQIEDKRWRAYADEQNMLASATEAYKDARWVSPVMFWSLIPEIRNTIAEAIGEGAE